MILDYPENLKGKELYTFLMNLSVIHTERKKKYDKNDYDPGKYCYHTEKLEDDIYGCYYQSYDSPEGDNWRMYIYKVTKDGIQIIQERNDDNRFFYKNLFKEELFKIPYGKIKEI